MTSVLNIDAFLEGVEELEPFSVFEHYETKSFLVCDDDLYSALLPRVRSRFRKRLIPIGKLRSRIRWRFAPKHAVYCVLSLKSEGDSLSALRAQFPQLTFIGFCGDFLTSKSARSNALSTSTGASPEPEWVYAVCCTARAGSTYLCELLGKSIQNHLPYENFRPAILFLYEHRKPLNFDIRVWFDLTIGAQSVRGLFGTKVIGQFLSRLSPLIDAEDAAWFQSRIRDLAPKIVYLVREDKVEQSVSQFVARELQLWHLRSGRNPVSNKERSEEYRERKQNIVYDYGAIASHYEGMVRAEKRLQGMLDKLDLPIHKITYEGLKADLEGTLSDILNFLDLPDAALPEDLSTNIQRGFDSKNAELVDRFKRDLAQKSDA